jgi:hypothetical protein
MRVHNEELILDGTDLTSNITSNAIELTHMVHYAVQIVFTGTGINGSFQVQGSCDKEVGSITNWTDIGAPVAVTAAGSVLLEDVDVGYKFARVVWTDSSSTDGTVTSARYNIKGA